jgi:hypothetical protein
MTATIADVLERPPSASFADVVATGGTLFANALSMAAARVTLAEVLTAHAYEHELGERLTDGIESAAAAHGLRWRAHRLYNRSGYTHAPETAFECRRGRGPPSTPSSTTCNACTWPTAASGMRSTRPAQPVAFTPQRQTWTAISTLWIGFLDEVAPTD